MKAAPTVWLQPSRRTQRPSGRLGLNDAPHDDRLLQTEADPLARELARGADPRHRRGRDPAQARRPSAPPASRCAARRTGSRSRRSIPPSTPSSQRGDRLLLIGGDTVRRVSTALEALREQPSTEIVAQRGDEIVTVSYLRPAARDRLVLPGPGRDRRPLPADRPLHRPARAVASEPPLLPLVRGVERLLHPGGDADRPAPGRRHRQGAVRGRGAGAPAGAAAHAPLLPHLPGRAPAAGLDAAPGAVPLPARRLPRRAAVGPDRQRRHRPARLALERRDGRVAAAPRPRRARCSSSRSR